MRGKVRMVFLAVLIVALTGAAQAETIIPMVVGYSATYEVNWAGSPSTNPFTASMQITGGPQDPFSDGNQWWTLQFNNWDGDGLSEIMMIRATADALYINGSTNPHFMTGPVGTTWTDEGGRTPTITAIGNFSTPGGLSFTDVYTLSIPDYDNGTGELYQTLTEYWKPGLGFLGEVVPRSYGDSGLPRTTYVTTYATPVPPSLLLLGSGLAGLLAVRRVRRR